MRAFTLWSWAGLSSDKGSWCCLGLLATSTSQRRASHRLVVGAIAFAALTGEAHSQTAALLEFRSDAATGSGVDVNRGVGFVLVKSGVWPQPSEREASVQPEPAERKVVAASATDCAIDDLPPAIEGLSAAVARRRLLFWRIVAHHECRYRLPPGLLDAVILQESRYTPEAVSRAGAQGLAQLMPGTAAALGVVNPFDPVHNIDGGARYLGAMLGRFGSVSLGLAAYNAGPGRVSAARGMPANRETPDYVRRVLAYWHAGTRGPLESARATAVALGFSDPSRD